MNEVLVPEKARKTVSHSEVEAYLRCERNHYYGYGLGIQRITTSTALNRGILGHGALEVYFKFMMDAQTAGTWSPITGPAEAFNAAMTWLSEQNNPLFAEVLGYITWFFKAMPMSLKTCKIIGVEQEYSLKINDDLEYPFVVDLVIENSVGQIKVIDHKFMYDFISERDMELMPQLPKYVGALRALGMRVDVAGYNQIRTRTVKNPTAESQYRYEEFLLPDTRIRETFREQLIVSDRIQQRKQHVIDNEDGLYHWSQDAVRTSNKMVCNSCSFRSLCVAELNGQDASHVLDAEYMKRERREIAAQKLLEIEA